MSKDLEIFEAIELGKIYFKMYYFIFLDFKITTDGDCSNESKRYLLLERNTMINWNSILKSRDITLPIEIHLVKATVFLVVMYGCQSWTIKKAEHWRIDAFELWCWRRLLRVLCTARISKQLSDQIRSVAQSCPTLCDPMNRSTPGLPVHHQLLEFTETHIHRVSDAMQPSHPLSSPSPLVPNPSQHQSLFQWVNSSHEVAKVLEFQL